MTGNEKFIFDDKELEFGIRDQKWLDRVLEEHRTDVKSTFLLTVDGKGHVIWIGKEGA